MKNKTKILIIGIIITTFIVLVLIYLLKDRSIKEGSVSGNHYEVGEMKMACGDISGHGDYFERGYSITRNTNSKKVIYNVSLGTNGIDLSVKSIKDNKEGGIIITINEKTKSKKSFNSWPSCPNIDITFDKEPISIIIQNTKNDQFGELKK